MEYCNRYEPWGIVDRRRMPFFDVRFRGYGRNKIVFTAALNASGFGFEVGRQSTPRASNALSESPVFGSPPAEQICTLLVFAYNLKRLRLPDLVKLSLPFCGMLAAQHVETLTRHAVLRALACFSAGGRADGVKQNPHIMPWDLLKHSQCCWTRFALTLICVCGGDVPQAGCGSPETPGHDALAFAKWELELLRLLPLHAGACGVVHCWLCQSAD